MTKRMSFDRPGALWFMCNELIVFCQCFLGDGPQNLPCSLPNFKHATFEIPSTKQESATYARTSFICCRVCGLDDGQIERKSGRLPDWSCLVTFAFLASPSIFVQKARISTVQTPLTQEQMCTMFPYKGFGAAAASLVRNWGLPAPVCQCQSCSSDRVNARVAFCHIRFPPRLFTFVTLAARTATTCTQAHPHLQPTRSAQTQAPLVIRGQQPRSFSLSNLPRHLHPPPSAVIQHPHPSTHPNRQHLPGPRTRSLYAPF
jgi:hypothetical protein